MQAQGLLAAAAVLSGQGSALNVDPSGLLRLLYNMLAEPLPHGEAALTPEDHAGNLLVRRPNRTAGQGIC
eukprot:1173665-Prorocentrum_minimum.AAC.1